MTDSVEVQMGQILDEYVEKVHEVTNESIKHSSKEAVQKLRSTSPRNEKGKRAGRYARGWTKKAGDYETVVYNKTDWQLTHLLANGHVVVNRYGDTGARTKPDSHIADVEKWAMEDLPMRVSRGLK